MYFMFDMNKEPEIKKIFEQYNSDMDMSKSRLKLLEKQIKKEAESRNEIKKEFWKKVYEFAKDKDLIPSECTEDWKMEFNVKTGHFFCSEPDEEPSIPDFIKHLIR